MRNEALCHADPFIEWITISPVRRPECLNKAGAVTEGSTAPGWAGEHDALVRVEFAALPSVHAPHVADALTGQAAEIP